MEHYTNNSILTPLSLDIPSSTLMHASSDGDQYRISTAIQTSPLNERDGSQFER